MGQYELLVGESRKAPAGETYDAAGPADDMTYETLVDGWLSADTSGATRDTARRVLQSGDSSSEYLGLMLQRVSDVAGN